MAHFISPYPILHRNGVRAFAFWSRGKPSGIDGRSKKRERKIEIKGNGEKELPTHCHIYVLTYRIIRPIRAAAYGSPVAASLKKPADFILACRANVWEIMLFLLDL